MWGSLAEARMAAYGLTPQPVAAAAVAAAAAAAAWNTQRAALRRPGSAHGRRCTQGNIKRDPASYSDEFQLQWRHYKACLALFLLKPDQEGREFGDLINFIAQVRPALWCCAAVQQGAEERRLRVRVWRDPGLARTRSGASQGEKPAACLRPGLDAAAACPAPACAPAGVQ